MYPTKAAKVGSAQICKLAAPTMDLAREMSTVVHPDATHARCDHVDCRLGSLSRGGVLAVAFGGGGGTSRGSITSWFGSVFSLVVVAAKQCTRVVRIVSEGHVWKWRWELKGSLFWVKMDIGKDF
ncbi:hypothetical protein PanWU01x14_216080, partial [Parasponia andersonii]